jgi:hypothetical protein
MLVCLLSSKAHARLPASSQTLARGSRTATRRYAPVHARPGPFGVLSREALGSSRLSDKPRGVSKLLRLEKDTQVRHGATLGLQDGCLDFNFGGSRHFETTDLILQYPLSLIPLKRHISTWFALMISIHSLA